MTADITSTWALQLVIIFYLYIFNIKVFVDFFIFIKIILKVILINKYNILTLSLL